MSDATKSTMKTKKRIFAIPAAAPAIPVKPNTAASNAMIKNVMAHPSIVVVLSGGGDGEIRLRSYLVVCYLE